MGYQKAGIIATLALAGAGIYGLANPGHLFGTEQVKTADAVKYTKVERSNKALSDTHAEVVQAGDGAWHAAKRTIYDALQRAEELKMTQEKDTRLENIKITVDGVEVSALNNNAVNKLARRLPADERNAKAFYCPKEHSIENGCSEEYVRLGSKDTPNKIYSDIKITFDVIKTTNGENPAQYKTVTRTAPAWYTASTFGGAVVVAAGTALYNRRRQEGLDAVAGDTGTRVLGDIVITADQPLEQKVGGMAAREFAVPAEIQTAMAAHAGSSEPLPAPVNNTPAIEPLAEHEPGPAAREFKIPTVPPFQEPQRSPYRVDTAVMKTKGDPKAVIPEPPQDRPGENTILGEAKDLGQIVVPRRSEKKS